MPDPSNPYNQPAALNATSFAAMVERTMNAMWDRPFAAMHGSVRSPHITWPGGVVCVECGEDVGPLGAAYARAGEQVVEDPSLIPLNEAERHAAWVAELRAKLVAAVEAIERGKPVNWDTWPRAGQPAEPDDAWEPPQYEGLGLEPRPYASGDVWQNVLDLYADMDRYREQHGPFLRELRCTAAVRLYLVALIGRGEAKPWELPPLTRVPLIDDADIPAGAVRFVYDDGTTRDVQVIAAVRYEADTDWAFEIPFPAIGEMP